MKLEPGMKVPAFDRTDDTGADRSYEDFRGRGLVIYFYPKVFTPGCTGESCDFRDNHDRLLKAGYAVVGVSPDPTNQLADFRSKYELPFSLLSDVDHSMAVTFGAWGLKKNYGREYEGIIRSTFVVGADGTIEQAWYNVRAKGHVGRVTGTVIDS